MAGIKELFNGWRSRLRKQPLALGPMPPTHMISVCVSHDRVAVTPRDGWPSVNWDCDPLRFCTLDETDLANTIESAFWDAPRLRTYVGSEDLRTYRSPLERQLGSAEFRVFARHAKFFQVAKLDARAWRVRTFGKNAVDFEKVVIGDPNTVVQVIVSRL